MADSAGRSSLSYACRRASFGGQHPIDVMPVSGLCALTTAIAEGRITPAARLCMADSRNDDLMPVSGPCLLNCVACAKHYHVIILPLPGLVRQTIHFTPTAGLGTTEMRKLPFRRLLRALIPRT